MGGALPNLLPASTTEFSIPMAVAPDGAGLCTNPTGSINFVMMNSTISYFGVGPARGGNIMVQARGGFLPGTYAAAEFYPGDIDCEATIAGPFVMVVS